MNTWVKVARYHLVDRISYTAGPWGLLAFHFALIVAIFKMAGPTMDVPGKVVHDQAFNLVVIYVFFMVLGLLAIVRSVPFGLAIGVSRRSYYAGTASLAVALAAVYGLALTVLQAIERATGGWGMDLHFFRIPYVLDGPWYLTWLTSFVGLSLMFIYGMWWGLVYRRWNLLGLLAFIAALGIVLGAGVVVTSHAHAWSAIGRFFTTLSAAGLTGLLAALAVALLAGGYLTMRRVTV
jgi:hypothetical protein